MRKYIKDNDYYYELDDTHIEKNEEFENIYFYKSFDNFKTFEVVYKNFNIKELRIYTEFEIPSDEVPQHFDYIEPKWYMKILNYFKNLDS